jgi:probable DNA metabolism protein
MHEITLTDLQFNKITGEIHGNVKADDEDLYRSLWKAYYKAINIPERKNTRLRLRLMPRRYWKYMPEKQ